MPIVVLPNSNGEPRESYLCETWSAEARAAAARSRQRRRNITRLQKLRQKYNDKLLNQMNVDRAMGRGKSVTPEAGKHWFTINVITGRIQGLQRSKTTIKRPLISRLKKRLRRVF